MKYYGMNFYQVKGEDAIKEEYAKIYNEILGDIKDSDVRVAEMSQLTGYQVDLTTMDSPFDYRSLSDDMTVAEVKKHEDKHQAIVDAQFKWAHKFTKIPEIALEDAIYERIIEEYGLAIEDVDDMFNHLKLVEKVKPAEFSMKADNMARLLKVISKRHEEKYY